MRISDWSSDVCSSDLVLEPGERVLAPADQRQRVAEPEAAREKRALARRQAVRDRVRAIAQHEAVHGQLALDRLDRAAHHHFGRTARRSIHRGNRTTAYARMRAGAESVLGLRADRKSTRLNSSH